MALIKEWRLKKKEDFDKLAKTGRRETTPLLKIWWLWGAGLAAVRVSKKISKKAVVRNKIRRVLAEKLRESREVWKDKEMVVIVREMVDKKNRKQLIGELEQIIKKWTGERK